MHSLSQNRNGSRESSLVFEAGDYCSYSLQWNQWVKYGPVLSLCPLLLDLEWGCGSTNHLDMEEL